jgi:hypothetical protein
LGGIGRRVAQLKMPAQNIFIATAAETAAKIKTGIL